MGCIELMGAVADYSKLCECMLKKDKSSHAISPSVSIADSRDGPISIMASIYLSLCKCRRMKHRTFQENNYLFWRVGPFITYNVIEWLWKTWRGGDSNEFHLWGSQQNASTSKVEKFQRFYIRLLLNFKQDGKGGAPLSSSMQLLWWICSGKIFFYHVYSNIYVNFLV